MPTRLASHEGPVSTFNVWPCCRLLQRGCSVVVTRWKKEREEGSPFNLEPNIRRPTSLMSYSRPKVLTLLHFGLSVNTNFEVDTTVQTIASRYVPRVVFSSSHSSQTQGPLWWSLNWRLLTQEGPSLHRILTLFYSQGLWDQELSQHCLTPLYQGRLL